MTRRLTPLQRVLGALRHRGVRPRLEAYFAQWHEARCPAHDDAGRSLTVDGRSDGSVSLRCDGGCSESSILKALGLKKADLAAPPQRRARKGGRR